MINTFGPDAGPWQSRGATVGGGHSVNGGTMSLLRGCTCAKGSKRWCDGVWLLCESKEEEKKTRYKSENG